MEVRPFRRALSRQLRFQWPDPREGYDELLRTNAYVPLLEDPELLDDDPVDLLFNVIYDNPDLSTVQLLSGFRGTGKTTALFRLQDQLRNENYAALRIDVQDYLNTSTAPQIEEFLAFVSVAAEVEARRRLKVEPPGREGRFAKLLAWFKRVQVEKVEAEVGVGDHAKVAVELGLKDQRLLEQYRQGLAGRLDELTADVRESLRDLTRRTLTATGRDGLVLMVDSVEQYRGTVGPDGTALPIQQAVQELFDIHGSRLDLGLPGLHLIYTVPPYLSALAPGIGGRFEPGGLRMIPAMKIRDRTGAPYEPGIAKLTTVAARRIEAAGAAPSEVLAPDDLRSLVLASGGLVRELMRALFELSIRLKGLPVDVRVVRSALAQLRDDRGPIADNDLRIMWRVMQEHSEAIPDLGNGLADFARLLEYGNVLYYENGDDTPWYAVNPLLEPLVEERYPKLVELGSIHDGED